MDTCRYTGGIINCRSQWFTLVKRQSGTGDSGASSTSRVTGSGEPSAGGGGNDWARGKRSSLRMKPEQKPEQKQGLEQSWRQSPEQKQGMRQNRKRNL